MLATRSELLEKIRLGEDSFLEMKEVKFAGGKVRGPTQDGVANELAAFANSAGGVLLLGVEDTSRTVIGIELDKLDAVETVLREACEQSIKPPLAPIIERLTLPDAGGIEQPVIRVEVKRSLFVHQSPGGYLQRVGSSRRPIPPDQLARLFQQRSQSRLIRFDEMPVPGATLEPLCEDLWRRFVVSEGAAPREVALRKLAMAAQDDDGAWRPTVAGLLLGSERPQEFLPSAYIQAVAYQGTTVVPQGESAYQIDASDMTGPLDRQIHAACAFVRKNMQVAAFKQQHGGRVDMPQFSMRAVFEAITNAVAHRDYSIHGAKVRLRLFADRLEIYSPGMLPNTMDTESLVERQSARNEALASLLARCPMEDSSFAPYRNFIMDRRGEGVPIILRETLELGGKPAHYRMIDQSELLLVIPAANPEAQP
ncbi:putative transcriptional regulator [Verminephrobacter eiseniae EF01-2]|uniref:Putative transcriptional regulator n=2 Tax=Verminephrobacter eiseniae TaxID=364317 RepID=A1WL64_VEREI|nr:putative transcriptional regulator [Verminephrobacter eiseniae EF01-2]MCW5283949.1 transcriptional regulator [Verminephrobacter eiseniae]MCW5301658.1 transcriptional regulator [Verminephrobacter eiseniae]MCW8180324.1 transcriptional regulator [Verminephrobacter eiseniae]MCW8192541.1 transcriptional regulator [Verminephrobacter eiseniae]